MSQENVEGRAALDRSL